MRRAAKETSNDEYHHAPRFLAGRGLVLGEDRRVGLEGVPVEQDGEVRITVCNELVGYVRSGFLQDDCVESSASGGNDLYGIPARWSWIPLQNGETKLMMHMVTIRIVNVAKSSRFRQSETDHGQDYRPRLRERATSVNAMG